MAKTVDLEDPQQALRVVLAAVFAHAMMIEPQSLSREDLAHNAVLCADALLTAINDAS